MGRPISLDLTAPAPPFVLPEFSVCSEWYGESLDTLSCYAAADHLPHGTVPRTFDVSRLPNNLPPYHALPFSIQEGTCYISVETAGPTYPVTIDIPPDDLRNLAAQTIQTCVFRSNGIGGFGTYRFENMFNYLVNSAQNGQNWPPPASTTFITLTVSGARGRLTRPGDQDSEVPEHLGKLIRERSREFTATRSWNVFQSIARYLHVMGRMGEPWWGKPYFDALDGTLVDADDKMTYECNSRLGSPSPKDCSHLEYAELGPDGDNVQVGPGFTRFLNQGSCAVGISSSIPVTLTWEQIRLAISALIGVCVLDPVAGSQGGMAYYGKPTSLVGEERRKRKKRGHDVEQEKRLEKRLEKRALSGFNALPLHVNITLFQQK